MLCDRTFFGSRRDFKNRLFMELGLEKKKTFRIEHKTETADVSGRNLERLLTRLNFSRRNSS